MAVPYTFANATVSIPLAQLDNNFETPITIGNTAVELGNTITTLNNITLANVTISSVSTPATVSQGGTGRSNLTLNNVILGNNTGTVQLVSPGSSGNVLTSNGTTWESTAPASFSYPGAGLAVSTGSAWGTSKTAPSGDVVGTTDTQTLSGKTITGTKETVYTITDGAAFEIDPANGGIQTITLGANRTPAATNFTAGQSVTLMVNDGSAYTITWTTVNPTWVGGSAPTLATSGYTVIEFWKVGSTIYGAYVGAVA